MSATATVPARINLAGNPSDGYGGAVLSTAVPALGARVRATVSHSLAVAGPARAWRSVAELRADAERFGHDGGDRLVTAAIVTLDRFLPPAHRRPPLHLDWSTTIPRCVGLGGSSAIVVATMRAALGCWGLEIPPGELAEVALLAETEELGITGGLADRVAQVWGGTVLTDVRGPASRIAPVAVHGSPRVLLAWDEAAASPSGRYHGELRARFDACEPGLADAMADLAGLADAATEALTVGDRATFADAVDASLRARCTLGPVPPAALEPVEVLRAGGAGVNFAGSGGALVLVGDHVEAPPGWDSLDVAIT
jgi:glucuronokinase